MIKQVDCSLYRGGSSKAAFFLESDLPVSDEERALIFQKIMGGNDPKQIDGLGGAQIVTSKVAVVGPSSQPFCDVDYTFVQVYPNRPGVDTSANCGNISSAVAMFAIEKGLVSPREGKTTVRIYNTNTGKVISETLETPEAAVVYEGDFRIPGVPGTGSRIELSFEDPSGAITGKLLPTGHAVDYIALPSGKSVPISVVDCSSLFVFVPMEELGLNGHETIGELERNQQLLDDLEYLRGLAAVLLGMTDTPEHATERLTALPKIALVGGPADYQTSDETQIGREEMDLRICMMTLGKPHKSFAVTGAMCTAGAASVPGSVVNNLCSAGPGKTVIRLANPAGVMETGIVLDKNSSILSAIAYRTARLLMSGRAFYSDGAGM